MRKVQLEAGEFVRWFGCPCIKMRVCIRNIMPLLALMKRMDKVLGAGLEGENAWSGMSLRDLASEIDNCVIYSCRVHGCGATVEFARSKMYERVYGYPRPTVCMVVDVQCPAGDYGMFSNPGLRANYIDSVPEDLQNGSIVSVKCGMDNDFVSMDSLEQMKTVLSELDYPVRFCCACREIKSKRENNGRLQRRTEEAIAKIETYTEYREASRVLYKLYYENYISLGTREELAVFFSYRDILQFLEQHGDKYK